MSIRYWSSCVCSSDLLAGLVQGDRQHPWVVPEVARDAGAVVHVDVDVGHSLRAVVQQPLDRHRDVVVDTEAAGPPGHRVVQPAHDVDTVQVLAGPDPAGRLDARTDDPRTGLVHPGEDRGVLPAQTVLKAGAARVLTETTDPVDRGLEIARASGRERVCATG